MSAQHLADKPLKLATCPRCKAYVLAGQLSGLRVAVDPAPVTGDAFRAALLAGKRVYRLIQHSGRPHSLADVMMGSSLHAQTIMVEHPCAVRSARPVVYEEVAVGPQSAPVTPGRGVGGFHQSHAPAEGSRGLLAARSPAKRANRHRSNVDHDRRWLYRRCEACGEQMGYEQPFGIMIGDLWAHVWHDPCPTKEIADAGA